jgi:hypothetical protein
MPDRAEVEKLLMTISSLNTRIIRHIHGSESSDLFLVEHKGQKRILKVVCFTSQLLLTWLTRAPNFTKMQTKAWQMMGDEI